MKTLVWTLENLVMKTLVWTLENLVMKTLEWEPWHENFGMNIGKCCWYKNLLEEHSSPTALRQPTHSSPCRVCALNRIIFAGILPRNVWGYFSPSTINVSELNRWTCHKCIVRPPVHRCLGILNLEPHSLGSGNNSNPEVAFVVGGSWEILQKIADLRPALVPDSPI